MPIRSNIEARARAYCEAQTARLVGYTPAEAAKSVDRTWQIAAALMEAGLIDDDGVDVPHTFEQGWAAVKDWRARHPHAASRMLSGTSP